MTSLEQKMGYQFKDIKLLARALTHKSFANELKVVVEHNEKLEFLGDAVVDLIVGDYLFKKFPQDTEGGLSKKRASVVNEEVLSEIAKSLDLNEQLHLGKGEVLTGGAQKPRLLASVFEALIGALYIDGGFEAAKSFLIQELAPWIERICAQEDYEKDYKTRLQEYTQKFHKETPRYELLNEEGPSHDRVFSVCVKVNDEVWAHGQGRSKKMAEQDAAKLALELKNKETI